MITDRELLAAFERQYIRSEKMNHSDALRLFEEMWKEGVLLGVLPMKDPFEGIEVENLGSILSTSAASLRASSSLPIRA